MNTVQLNVEQIDLAMAKLKSLRTMIATLGGIKTKFDEAEGGFNAAKAGAREAMENDEFDKQTAFTNAMKRQHKTMEDLRDRKTDLEAAVGRITEELMDWPLTPLAATATAPEQPTKNEEQVQEAA